MIHKNIIYCMLISFYFPILGQEVPIPKGLVASIEEQAGFRYIKLSWQKKSIDDTLTNSYYVYNNFPPDRKLYLNGRINRTNDHQISVKAKYPYGAEYRFAVQAVSSHLYDLESPLSDTVTIFIPSLKLPPIHLIEAKFINRQIYIKIDYPIIHDLKRFELFINDRLFTLASEKREWSIFLEEPKDVLIRLKAATENVESPELKKIIIQNP